MYRYVRLALATTVDMPAVSCRAFYDCSKLFGRSVLPAKASSGFQQRGLLWNGRQVFLGGGGQVLTNDCVASDERRWPSSSCRRWRG